VRDAVPAVVLPVGDDATVLPTDTTFEALGVPAPLVEVLTPGIPAARAFALERLGEPLPLTRLAGSAAMSVRTFTRRFREETGTSPQQWLAAQRLSLARELLESTDRPVDRIAADAGFGTAASLRGSLRASIGVSPLTYRRT
jgi:transcriptional regulator GlxA family with amidase domain